MKNLFFLTIVFISNVLISSCNNPDPNPVENPKKISSDYDFSFVDSLKITEPIIGLRIFYLPKDVALAMNKTFDTVYRNYNGTEITYFKNRYWLDSNTIGLLGDYFNRHKQYDGLRIHFTAEGNITDMPTNGYKKLTGVKLFATTKRIKIDTTKSNHVDDDEGINVEVDTTTQPYFAKKSDVAKGLKVFEKYYGSNMLNVRLNKRLSHSIWVDRNVIDILAKLVAANGKKLNGVNILTASYLGIDGENLPSGVGKYKKQGTIILVPTKSNTAQEEDWNVITSLMKYIEEKKDTKRFNFFGAYNHGELCPQICQ